MPLGTPLPPPLPLPPPPRPSRLSWPGPRCLPRTIVPSTAAGGGRGAGRGTQEALRGAGRGCGVRRPGGLAGTMNQAPQTHSPRSSSPGRQESPFCRAAAAAFLGMARPGRRSGRAGGEAGSCPSFLPFFEVKIPSSRWGGSARRGPGGLRCQPPRLGGARGLRAPRPCPAALPRDGGRGWRISCLGLSGNGPAAAVGPRVWSVLARPRRLGRAGAARMAHSGRPPATPGGPSRLAAHRARPGARAARPPAPRAPRPAAGCRRESMPGVSSPGARSGSALPRPRALRIGRPARVSPAAGATQKVPAALRPPARAPAPAIFVNLQLPSEPEKLKGRAGAERQRETPPPPRAAPPSAAVGAPPARRAAGAVLVPAGLAPARRRRRRLGRSLPGAYRNLLCGVTAFRLNPASSSRLPPPPRRSRMLARCAAPPPGSGRLREDAAAHRGRRARPVAPGLPAIPGDRREGRERGRPARAPRAP